MASKIPYGQRKLEAIELKTEENGSLLWIIFNRPKFLNSLSRQLTSELHGLLDELKDDRTVRVIVLAGNGRGFSAGESDLDCVAWLLHQPGRTDFYFELPS